MCFLSKNPTFFHLLNHLKNLSNFAILFKSIAAVSPLVKPLSNPAPIRFAFSERAGFSPTFTRSYGLYSPTLNCYETSSIMEEYMEYYITYGEYQKHLKNYYLKTGNRTQFREMIQFLYQKNLLSETPPSTLPASKMIDDISDEEINRFMDSLVFTITAPIKDPTHVLEGDVIPSFRDIFIIRHSRYTRQLMHTHNYFEINYVASGHCTFAFENNSRTMKEGELCIIAPDSLHDIIVDDESLIVCIMLRKSTFNKTFLSLLSRKDLLAEFFRSFLTESDHANYLLFYCDRSRWIRQIIFNAMAECYKKDAYSNTCCISWLNQLFAYLLRNYSKTLRFYNYQLGSEFSLVLQYIQYNYQHLTLSSLADFFHYSEPYLCTLIKQNTGKNFTDLIKDLRLSEAVGYLLNTNMPIGEIAEKIGYNSSDHFSRVFRSHYKMSPQKYRKEYRPSDDSFQTSFSIDF